MPDPIKMPPRPLAPGQVEVKLGAKRYVLNPNGFDREVSAEASGVLAFPAAPAVPPEKP